MGNCERERERTKMNLCVSRLSSLIHQKRSEEEMSFLSSRCVSPIHPGFI